MSFGNLNIFYQNVRGLKTKCLELYKNILSYEYDIIIITETNIQSDISSNELCDSQYDVFRCDRKCGACNKHGGGGVMVCTRRELGASERLEWACSDTVELLWVTIPARAFGLSTPDLHVAAVHISPDASLPNNLTDVVRNLTGVVENYPTHNFLIAGDFNLPCIQWRDLSYTLIHKGTTELQNAAIKAVEDLS